jgi:hypothetical protein
MLNSARVVSLVGQLVTGAVTKHVRVHWKRQSRLLARSTHDLANCRITQRATAFAHEYVWEVACLALESTQRSNLNAAQRMDGSNAVLQPMHVKTTTNKIDGVPRQADHFRDPQTMPIGHQEQRGVTMTMATTVSSRPDKSLNFVLGQVFARTDVAVLWLTRK